MKCPKCGADIPPTAKGCRCGYHGTGVPGPAASANPGPAASANPAPAASANPAPTDGERAFAWFFAIVYVTAVAIIAVIVATVVVRYLLHDAPQFAPWLLGLLVYGMVPHAAKITAESVARTRGKDVWTRFVDIVSSM